MAEQYFGNWKILHDNGTFHLKVVNFPGNESMWVLVQPTEGNDFEGWGTLDNDPIMSTLKCGDRVQYAGGTATDKPSFVPSGV